MRWIAAAAVAISFNAQAEFFTGNELYAHINSESIVEQSTAIGYIAGVTDSLIGVSVCLPRGVNLGQIRDLVKSHIGQNPSSRHFSADSLITNLLNKTWPCRSSGRSS